MAGAYTGAYTGVGAKNRGRARGPRSGVRGPGSTDAAQAEAAPRGVEVWPRRPAPETSPRPAAYRPLRRQEGRCLDTRRGGAPRPADFPRLLLGSCGLLNSAWCPAGEQASQMRIELREGAAHRPSEPLPGRSPSALRSCFLDKLPETAAWEPVLPPAVPGQRAELDHHVLQSERQQLMGVDVDVEAPQAKATEAVEMVRTHGPCPLLSHHFL
ncbi:uncharacterized protein LOC101673693 isoform X1 [Mustela putorius furo]|uniref:Uncharacterized protein LOC101673693 isoform X1 n=1 Tax=Mustela putorius furo TaxID=9669 RepID=A0A8U0T8B9_MUSPF|nr:uncharacterized protein LOC101673693 isoform X1 [Mustela putorius furo]